MTKKRGIQKNSMVNPTIQSIEQSVNLNELALLGFILIEYFVLQLSRRSLHTPKVMDFGELDGSWFEVLALFCRSLHTVP